MTTPMSERAVRRRMPSWCIGLGCATLIAASCGSGGDEVAVDSAAEPAAIAASTTEPSTGSTAAGEPAGPPATVAPATGGPEVSSLVDDDSELVVVALGEEFLLADLLALGITPIASTATVASAGFQGLAPFDTSGIEVLSSTERNIERLAAYQADLIVTTESISAQIGDDVLASMSEVVVVPDSATALDRLRILAERFGANEEADRFETELAASRARLANAVAARTEPCEVSLATVYPGPSPAAWTSGVTDIPAAVIDAGCELRPGPDAPGPDRNGRLFLSLEQLGVLDAPLLLLLQSSIVEGEDAAVAELADTPLWSSIPAVAAGRVETLDRLAYPGVAGLIRLSDDLVDLLSA
jgi:iron complex transport system substrate-binding protein